MAKKKIEKIEEEVEVISAEPEVEAVEAELAYSDDGDVAIAEEEAAIISEEKAEDEALAAEAEAEEKAEEIADVGTTSEDGLEVVEEKPLAPAKPNSRFFIAFSYFALMIGAVMVILNKFIDSLSFLNYVSQLMSFLVVAIVALPFFRGKAKGWKIAYFVALAVLAVFIVWPLAESIIEALPEKKASEEFIRFIMK